MVSKFLINVLSRLTPINIILTLTHFTLVASTMAPLFTSFLTTMVKKIMLVVRLIAIEKKITCLSWFLFPTITWLWESTCYAWRAQRLAWPSLDSRSSLVASCCMLRCRSWTMAILIIKWMGIWFFTCLSGSSLYCIININIWITKHPTNILV